MITTLLLLSACGSVVRFPDEGAPPPVSPPTDDTGLGDTAPGDTAGDTSTDTASDTSTDTSGETAGDTATDTSVDTAAETGSIDTGSIDTGSLDTGSVDTGSVDTGPEPGSVSAYTGTWSAGSTTTALGVGVHPWHVHTGDFDGDGRTDLAYSWNVATFGGDELHLAVHLQDSAGALGAPTHLATGHVTAFAGSFRVVDLDADGDDDLVAGHDDGVSVFLSDGAGGFVGPLDLLSGDSAAVRVGDVDGDGLLDLVGVGIDGSLQVWIGDGAGGFSAGFSGAAATAHHGESAALADLDADGDLDLTIGDTDGTRGVLFRTYLNDGTGTFDLAAPVTAPAELPAVTDLEPLDVDADGVEDIVAAGGLMSTYDMFVGSFGFSGGVFGVYHELTVTGGSAPTGVAIGDLDGDGDEDIFAANALYMHGQMFFSQGDGTWQHQEIDFGLWYQSDIFPDPIAIGDLNGDGCGDLVWRTDIDVIVAPGSGC